MVRNKHIAIQIHRSFGSLMNLKFLLSSIVLFYLLLGCKAKKEYSFQEAVYYDVDSTQISRIKFNDKLRSDEYAVSAKFESFPRQLVHKFVEGNIDNRETLITVLSERTERKISSNKPLIIMFNTYEPTQDFLDIFTSLYEPLEKELLQNYFIRPIYLFRCNKAAKIKIGKITWYTDPQQIIDRLFIQNFDTRYNFIVITADGRYMLRRGEFNKDQVFSILKALNIQS